MKKVFLCYLFFLLLMGCNNDKATKEEEQIVAKDLVESSVEDEKLPNILWRWDEAEDKVDELIDLDGDGNKERITIQGLSASDTITIQIESENYTTINDGNALVYLSDLDQDGVYEILYNTGTRGYYFIDILRYENGRLLVVSEGLEGMVLGIKDGIIETNFPETTFTLSDVEGNLVTDEIGNEAEPPSTGIQINSQPIEIEEIDGKFYINKVTLGMDYSKIISYWGEPDEERTPDPEDEYFEQDFDSWLYLQYDGFQLTLYDNALIEVVLRAEDFFFDQQWYKDLGGDYEIFEDYTYRYTAGSHILEFVIDDEPAMFFWEYYESKPSLSSGMMLNEFISSFNDYYNLVYSQKINRDGIEKISLGSHEILQEDNGLQVVTFDIDEVSLHLSVFLDSSNELVGAGLQTNLPKGQPTDIDEVSQREKVALQQITLVESLILTTNPNITPDGIEYIYDEIIRQKYEEFLDAAKFQFEGLSYLEETNETNHTNSFLITVSE